MPVTSLDAYLKTEWAAIKEQFRIGNTRHELCVPEEVL